jgi:hypothetical protein
MQRQGALAAAGAGRCMLVFALIGVVDLYRRTGGSLIHQHTLSVFLGFHLHSTYSCHRLSGPCCLIGPPASRPLLACFDP